MSKNDNEKKVVLSIENDSTTEESKIVTQDSSDDYEAIRNLKNYVDCNIEGMSFKE